jgi:peptidoglycan/LPS O-acetylase OafA/YrhL
LADAVSHFSTAPWTVFPVNLCLAFLAALASYKLVELPFLKLKDALHEKKTQLARSPAWNRLRQKKRPGSEAGRSYDN